MVPNPDADEEQKLLDLIDQFERSSTEYDIDADPLLEERVLHQINLFTESHKKIPLKHLTNSEDKLAVLTELHKFHANPQAMRAAMLSRGITWKSAWKDCVNFVFRCEACRAHNSAKLTHSALSSLFSARPWSVIFMDILGPVDWHGVNGKYAITDYGEAVAPSRVGKDVKRFYILLVVCACTGFLVCHVIDDKQAKTIQSALSSTFSLFDTPSLICSDQESSFKAKELVAWYQTLGAEFRYSATYNPKTNGLVERRVGIVKSIMQRLIADNTFKFENWEESVRAIQFYINSRLDRDSGYSPFMLMFGRFPAGADGRARQMKLNENFDFTEWTKLQNFVMLEAIPYHAAAKRARRRKYLEFHDVSRNVEQEALEIDQPVYLRNTIKKFGDAKWHGPFFVCWVRYNSNNKPSVYKLRGAGKTTGGILRGLYPRDQLKVIPNDSYAREIDDDTRHIEAIYHFHRGKKGIGCHYLIKYLDDNNPTWIHESLLNDNFMNDYHELRSKRNEKLIEKGKSISTPFSLKCAINVKLHPFLNNGQYVFRPDEDKDHDIVPKPTVIKDKDIPRAVRDILDFKSWAKSNANDEPAGTDSE
jgi:transposase InsO family protein